MKRYIKTSNSKDHYTYRQAIIKKELDGWHVYRESDNQHIRGPFGKWELAEQWVDDKSFGIL